MTTRQELRPYEELLEQLESWDGRADSLPALAKPASDAEPLLAVEVRPSRLASRPDAALVRTARARLLRGARGRRILGALALVLSLALAPSSGARLAIAVRILLDLLADELAPETGEV